MNDKEQQLKVLRASSFGKRIAEEEQQGLAQYFVETELWRRLWHSEIDVIYGPKGSGKSALYAYLQQQRTELKNRKTELVLAENPQGQPVFQGLVEDPPTSEKEFVALWKFYFLVLAVTTLHNTAKGNKRVRALYADLAAAGLVAEKMTLKSMLTAALQYVRRFTNPSAVESSLKLNAESGAVEGVAFKYYPGEPTPAQKRKGAISIDDAIREADEVASELGWNVWIAIDRLDVAFSQSTELETNALRALFRAYVDTLSLRRISAKIFLRDDIWRRLSDSGFREASHITRTGTISWKSSSLLNLVVRRMVSSTELCERFGLEREAVLADSEQQRHAFYKVFPKQVEIGEKRSSTWDWILARTSDGSGQAAPRELVHLLEMARENRINEISRGARVLSDGRLYSASSLKEALPIVSKVRLEQTLYAEHPKLKPYIEKLRREKTEQSWRSLGKIWGEDQERVQQVSQKLVDVGLFELRGTKSSPSFWVPFLYRDSLELVQGKASPA
jgi:hypothetical protein